MFDISTLEFVQLQNFGKNKNSQIWEQKCLIWVFLGWNLKTALSYFKSAMPNLSYCKIS